MGNIQFTFPTRIQFGLGEIEQVGGWVSRLGKKALLVTGKSSMRRTGVLEKVLTNLAAQDVRTVVFDEIHPNPSCDIVDQGALLTRKEGCDVVIGLGGGSAIDAAKCIAVAGPNGMPIWDCVNKKTFGLVKEAKNALPIIAIPTTAGTGSEADKFAVISNTPTKEKPGLGSPYFYPKLSIIDPQLMTTLPSEVTVVTGLDAFFHGIEALVSNRSNMFSDLFAERAIQLVVKYLPLAVKDSNDIVAREKMAFASLMGGMAMDMAGNILIHAMEHPLSAHFDISHGEGLLALWLPVMKFNRGSVPEKYAMIASLLGEETEGLSSEEIDSKAVTRLGHFVAENTSVLKLKRIEVSENIIKKLAGDTINTMGFTVKGNPKPVSIEQIETIYREAFL